MKSSLTVRQAAKSNLLIKGASLFDPSTGLDAKGDLLVRDGKIAEIAVPGPLECPQGAEAVEAEGLHIFPGFVDPHVHLRTPGREDEEDIDSGTRAAAAGGFCAIVAMPNTEPVTDNAAILNSLRERAAAEARVPVGFLAAITRGLAGEHMTEMCDIAEAGALGFTDDGLPLANARVLRQALQYQRACGGVLALHEEDPALSGDGVMHEGEVSAELGLAGIPAISESCPIARDAAIAGYERARCHMLHLSSALSVEAVARAKADGIAVSAEVTPHHLILDESYVRTLDTNFKMNPPLRAASDREALIAALKSGAIDCIASDHAPHSREEKELPFELAPMGTTGLETAFAALYTELVLPGVIDLGLLVEKMTCAAEVYSLPKPALAQGEDANLCLVDLEGEWLVGEGGYESRSDNCCFAGRRLKGSVVLTLAAGQEAYRRRRFAIRAAEEPSQRVGV